MAALAQCGALGVMVSYETSGGLTIVATETDDGPDDAPSPVPVTDVRTERLALPDQPKRRFPQWLIALIAAVSVLVFGALVATPVFFIGSAYRATLDLAPGMDRFVADQYPRYTVVGRRPFSNYRGSGESGYTYFLERDTDSRFVLAVDIIKPAKIDDRIVLLKMNPYRDYFTTDGVFSKHKLETTAIEDEDVDAVVAKYVKAMPSPSAVVVRSDYGAAYIILGIAGNARRQSGSLGFSGLQMTHIGEAWLEHDWSGGSSGPTVDYAVSPVRK